jgi:type I restriction enzyme, R subunit
MVFSEDSRIKIPCILHLVRLGYRYLSLKNAAWDEDTTIFPDLFRTAIARINPGIECDEIDRLLADVKLLLENEDLGRAFYEKLTERSGTRLIDFANFSKNSFHVVTELTCKNGDDEFRPDITLLINGMPLIFIEVKKPNNREGVLAERNRIIVRSRNSRFRRFINITQLMVFSNNMEYDDSSPEPVEGAFYASSSYDKPIFNYFREEDKVDLTELLADEDDAVENEVLRDNNLNVIKHSPEFIYNKSPDTPTNRICSSLFSRDRLSFLLQYSLAYVNEIDGLQKHVMRYPQLFATKAIERNLDAGARKGIIWHTQGSGKTALAYFNTRFLTDYFQRKGVISKFYFIVDRLDLLIQAQREFASRGLKVHTIDSRETFARDIKASKALHNHSGRPEITVVNIQKFQDDPDVVRTEDYDAHIQRIYFLDEVHRSYNPKGMAGMPNHKRKYEAAFPTVRIVQAAPGRTTTQKQLEAFGLVAAPEPVKEWTPSSHRPSPFGNRIWPSCDKCLQGAPMNKKGTGPDRSLADYTFAKFAAQRGFNAEEIAAELPNVSIKARERMQGNDPGYVTKTAENGVEAANRGKLRVR